MAHCTCWKGKALLLVFLPCQWLAYVCIALEPSSAFTWMYAVQLAGALLSLASTPLAAGICAQRLCQPAALAKGAAHAPRAPPCSCARDLEVLCLCTCSGCTHPGASGAGGLGKLQAPGGGPTNGVSSSNPGGHQDAGNGRSHAAHSAALRPPLPAHLSQQQLQEARLYQQQLRERHQRQVLQAQLAGALPVGPPAEQPEADCQSLPAALAKGAARTTGSGDGELPGHPNVGLLPPSSLEHSVRRSLQAGQQGPHDQALPSAEGAGAVSGLLQQPHPPLTERCVTACA